MGPWCIAALVYLPAVCCLVGVATLACFGYNRVKAEFNVGRSRFCIKADRPDGPRLS